MEHETTGRIGPLLYWDYDEEHKELLFYGWGEIGNYDYVKNVPPWDPFLKEVRTIQVGEDITGIGSFAFFMSPELTEVLLPESLLSIGEHAFFGCRKLEKLELPKGLREIGIGALSECRALEWLHLGADLETVEEGAFSESVRRGFTVDGGNPRFFAEDGVLYTDGGKTLLAHPLEGPFRCRDGVERIANFARGDDYFYTQQQK